jgi:hypothetical protein
MFVLLALAAVPAASSAAAAAKAEKFTALAYLPTSGATADVTITIDGYSSPEDVHALHALLADSGPDALLKALEKRDSMGKISRTGSVGFYDLKVIRSIPTERGRRIIAVTDRPIGFLEAYYNTRSTDYRFGVLRLDLEGDKGTGELIYAAKINVKDDGTIEIENYGITPVRLAGVHKL